MKIYWSILKKYWKYLIGSPLLILLFVLCETVQPYLMAKIIDQGVMPKDLQVITSVGLSMIGISLVGLVANLLNVYLSSCVSIRFSTDLRAKLFSKIQEFSFEDIDRFKTASLVTRLTNDISKIQHLVMLSMRIFLRAPLMLIMASFFVFRINPELSVIIAVAIPVLGVAMYFLLKKAFPFFMRIQQKIDRLNNVVRENLINMRMVKSFAREDYEQAKFDRSNEELKDTVIKASNLLVYVYPMVLLVMNVSVVAVLWLGNGQIHAGRMKVGELISFVNYFVQILTSLMMFSVTIMAYARAAASSRRIKEVMDTVPSLNDHPAASKFDDWAEKGQVCLSRVCFKHPHAKNDVLKNIDLMINGGEKIAVVGATGSGKSSLLHLILRLYEVSSGEILVDGVNVKEYPREELHRKIGMVLQVNELFTGTIADNLRWGNLNATQEEMEEAARIAEAHGFIMGFTQGYDTLLGRGGINLSGGQKQRICLARALLRSPKILILDDSTSAVDTETEKAILDNLKKALPNTTLIIVTQRVHLMQSADRVVVLDDGELKAEGTSDELLRSSVLYREIYQSQSLVF